MICLTGIQLGNQFLKDHEESTATPPIPYNRYIPGGFMRYMEPAVHMEYRSKMKGIISDAAFLEQRDPEFEHLQKLYTQIDYRHAFFSTRRTTENAVCEIEQLFLTYGLSRDTFFRSFLGEAGHSGSPHSQDKTALRNFIFVLRTS